MRIACFVTRGTQFVNVATQSEKGNGLDTKRSRKSQRNAALVADIMGGSSLPEVAYKFGITKQVAYRVFRRAALSGTAGDITKVAKRFKRIAIDLGIPVRSAGAIVKKRGARLIGMPDRWSAVETARKLARRAQAPTGAARIAAMKLLRDGGKTLQEIGDEFGVGRARVSQLLADAPLIAAAQKKKPLGGYQGLDKNTHTTLQHTRAL